MKRKTWKTASSSVGAIVLLLFVGCGSTAGFFNPAFVNTATGGVFPVTPGPGADFILVRALNETGLNAEFIITIEREVFETDENGNVLLDEIGQPIFRAFRETIRLNTRTASPANEIAVLFPCDVSPINLVGLGENLLPDDAAIFLGGTGTGVIIGGGVSVGDLAPLSRLASPPNFVCGDTIIFRAINSTQTIGTVKLQTFLLPGFEQPSVFAGPNTFVNYQNFLESQRFLDE